MSLYILSNHLFLAGSAPGGSTRARWVTVSIFPLSPASTSVNIEQAKFTPPPWTAGDKGSAFLRCWPLLGRSWALIHTTSLPTRFRSSAQLFARLCWPWGVRRRGLTSVTEVEAQLTLDPLTLPWQGDLCVSPVSPGRGCTMSSLLNPTTTGHHLLCGRGGRWKISTCQATDTGRSGCFFFLIFDWSRGGIAKRFSVLSSAFLARGLACQPAGGLLSLCPWRSGGRLCGCALDTGRQHHVWFPTFLGNGPLLLPPVSLPKCICCVVSGHFSSWEKDLEEWDCSILVELQVIMHWWFCIILLGEEFS